MTPSFSADFPFSRTGKLSFFGRLCVVARLFTQLIGELDFLVGSAHGGK
jgi:hypothetical protein